MKAGEEEAWAGQGVELSAGSISAPGPAELKVAPGREGPAATEECAVGWMVTMLVPYLLGLGLWEECPAVVGQPPAPKLSASEQQVIISFRGACCIT